MKKTTREIFYAARGQDGRKWGVIKRADLEARIDAHSDPPPHFDTTHIRWVEVGGGVPDGLLLRHMIAAMPGEEAAPGKERLPAVNYFEALASAGTGYWPPVSPLSADEIIAALEGMGAKVMRRHGRLMSIELPG